MNKMIRMLIVFVVFTLILFAGFTIVKSFTSQKFPALSTDNMSDSVYPLSIKYMRIQNYPGSEIIIEETLPQALNYNRYIVSYKSEGLKINALLTIPVGEKPKDGWPVIIFNHGYIPPREYQTTEKYVAYADVFSRNGYIVLKSDYRGHGNSEGNAPGGYGSPAYTIDILNAVSSIKKLKDPLNVNSQKLIVDASRIGMWGHSMGGHIAIRSMVISKDIKAGVIWAGVVASYPDLINRWRRSATPIPLPTGARRWRELLVKRFGSPEENPKFWSSISANSFLKDVSGPIQLHHGALDTSVPVEFSEKLDKELKASGKTSEIFIYEGDDHNLSNSFDIAIQRSVEFFDKYLKN